MYDGRENNAKNYCDLVPFISASASLLQTNSHVSGRSGFGRESGILLTLLSLRPSFDAMAHPRYKLRTRPQQPQRIDKFRLRTQIVIRL